MVKSVENGMSLPPFLVKCYEMVSDESTDDLISWAESNDSFIIWDESKFASQLLPKYFKHSNFSSFLRQLNIYGFRKIDTDRWQFANEAFIKGQKHLLKNIVRRKHPQAQAVAQRTHNPPQAQIKIDDHTPPSSEERRIALFEEVKKLKADRSALTQELKKLRQNQEISQSKLLIVKEQLKSMEKNQQQMLSFLVMAMQNPEFLSQFFQPKDNRLLVSELGDSKVSEVTDDFEQTPSDKMIVMYQPTSPKDEMDFPQSTEPVSDFDDFPDFDLSTDDMKALIMDIDLLLGHVDDDEVLLENNGQLILPGNDTMMDQRPFPTSDGDNELKSQAFDDFSGNIPSSFIQESKKPDDSDDAGDEDHTNQVAGGIHRMEL